MNILPLATAAIAGVLLDRLFGELRRWHPLVGFGMCVDAVEKRVRSGAPGGAIANRLRGLWAWMLLVLPLVALAAWFGQAIGAVADGLLLYLAIGARSLEEHAQAVAKPLLAGNLAEARRRVGWMVSRDTSVLDEVGVSRAAAESVLENGNDAIFGTLFWFFVAGGAGAVLFRLANTLDAMWGYKDERRIYFGWAAARLDDLLNLIPARLTALTYALLGKTVIALRCWGKQSGSWSSPNAGPVMAAGAGALGLRLGGGAIYHGQWEERSTLGDGDAPKAADILRASDLVQRGLWLWLVLFGLVAALLQVVA